MNYASALPRDYRSFVGPPDRYDLVGAMQFNVMTALGLREHHYLLDIGCGSLRAGRLFIPYLLPGRYFGIEPEQWLIEAGIEHEVGRSLVDLKRPTFSNESDFLLSVFDRTFDFVLAQSVLSHAPRHQIARCLGEVKRVLENDGIFAATFKLGERDYDGEGWVYPGLTAYRLETMQRLADHAGLRAESLGWRHVTGQTWLAIMHADRAGATESFAPPGEESMKRCLGRLQVQNERLARIDRHPAVRAWRAVRRPLYRLRDSVRVRR